MHVSPLEVSAPRARRGRVLVVGLGFLGSHVAAELSARGEPPVLLTRTLPAAGRIAELRPRALIVGDAGDPGVLEHALDGIGHVLFCAGGLLPAASEQDPNLDARLTLEPLAVLLDALARRPGVALTYLSSGGTVYGPPSAIPTPEEHPTRPIGSYGKLRLACERMIERGREQGLQARVLRCATVYGEHQRPDRGQGAVVTFLRRVAAGEPIFLFGEGDYTRDYLYAGDVARVVVALLDRTDGPAVLNVGSGHGTSLAQLVALVEAQVGRSARVVKRPERPFDVRRIVLDVSRLRGLVAFDPTPLAAGIERTHAWLAGPATAVEQAV